MNTKTPSGDVKAPQSNGTNDLGQGRSHRTCVPARHTFRAFWPITDENRPLQSLIEEARKDLPWLTAQAHAQLAGRGRWTVERSADVPGSGRVTETVLLFNAPAVEGRAPLPDSREEVA